VKDDDGKVSTVRYEAVNAMLLNEFLKEHRKVQEQEASILQLKAVVSTQQATALRLLGQLYQSSPSVCTASSAKKFIYLDKQRGFCRESLS
jgi:uncharacterized protein YgiM (DUF1202 family)